MTIANYRRRTGVSKLITLVKALCKLFGVFHDPITQWVKGGVHGPEQDIVLAWLANIQYICSILDGVPDD